MLTQLTMRALAVRLDWIDLHRPRGQEREQQLIMRQPLLLMVGINHTVDSGFFINVCANT